MGERDNNVIEQAKYALVIGDVSRSIGIGSLGEAGYTSSDPTQFHDITNGQDASGCNKNVMEKSNSIIDLDVVE